MWSSSRQHHQTPSSDGISPPTTPRNCRWQRGVGSAIVEEILDSKMMNQKLQYLIKWKDIGTNHNTWEPWDNVHAPELIVDFHWKYPGVARHIRVEFDLIKFRPVPMTIMPRHHFSGGVDIRGPSTPNLSSVPTTVPSFKYIPPHHHHPVTLPSTSHQHPSTISLLSTHCHFIVISLFPLSYRRSYLPFFVFTYILFHTAYSIILLFYGSTFIC